MYFNRLEKELEKAEKENQAHQKEVNNNIKAEKKLDHVYYR